MSDQELSPCPFCGGAGILIHGDYGRNRWYVECRNEHCLQMQCHEDEQRAAEAWNSRTSPAQEPTQ